MSGAAIASYSWDFGDGGTADGIRATHTYTEPGLYEVTLTVIDTEGAPWQGRKSVAAACPVGDLGPWISIDVGEPQFPGSAWRETGDSEAMAVCAGGVGLSGKSDGFHFVYRELRGDFTVSAHVSLEDLSGAMAGTIVGLMARETLDPGARYVAASVERSVDDASATVRKARYRRTSGGSSGALGSRHTSQPTWFRIERVAGVFDVSTSPDGLVWERLGRVPLGMRAPSMLVGIAAAGAEPSSLFPPWKSLLARAGDITVDCPASNLFVRGDGNADGAINIADAAYVLNYLLVLGPWPSCSDAADANDDGGIDVADAIKILGHLFARMGPLPEPFGSCGVDPTLDDLDCREYQPCRG